MVSYNDGLLYSSGGTLTISDGSITGSKLESLSTGYMYSRIVNNPSLDQTSILQSEVIEAASTHKNLQLPGCDIKISSPIVIPYKFGWRITGTGSAGTTITQWSNNTPIFLFQYGHTHDYEISHLGVRWNTQQTSADTQSIAFGYNNDISHPDQVLDGVQATWGHWDFSIHHIDFKRGFIGHGQMNPGITNPIWGHRLHDLNFSGLDWVGPAIRNNNTNGGCPNVSIKDVYVRCEAMTVGPVFDFVSLHDSIIDGVEVNNCNLPVQWYFNTCRNIRIGTVKTEFGTIDASSPYNGLISVANSTVSIGTFSVVSMGLNSPGNWHHAVRCSASGSYIDIENLTFSGPVPIAGQWSAFSCVSGSTIKRNRTEGFSVEVYEGPERVFGWNGNGVVYPGKTTTVGRPTASSVGYGGVLLDTTLNQLILSDGTNWNPVGASSNNVLRTGDTMTGDLSILRGVNSSFLNLQNNLGVVQIGYTSSGQATWYTASDAYLDTNNLFMRDTGVGNGYRTKAIFGSGSSVDATRIRMSGRLAAGGDIDLGGVFDVQGTTTTRPVSLFKAFTGQTASIIETRSDTNIPEFRVGPNTIGFYGTTPIAKQTGVVVSAAGIHTALTALGLIS